MAEITVPREALDQTPGDTPEVISDNGPEFENLDFVDGLKAESLKQIRLRVHNPHSN